eukprot:TRINITY_DN382_c0_g1_i3.p1 TRINITY_DN382_c0_g1~~TRINITY_DN382_c0_g1_i3.p1  ORF type:complete len:396 (+),score=175.84 TRINITY_DN382_c0_g1_i3:70-1257(+)
MASNHISRVRTLYRRLLKLQYNITTHRTDAAERVDSIRAEFESKRNLTNPADIQESLNHGEHLVVAFKHPDPQTLIWEQGGVAFMRNPTSLWRAKEERIWKKEIQRREVAQKQALQDYQRRLDRYHEPRPRDELDTSVEEAIDYAQLVALASAPDIRQYAQEYLDKLAKYASYAEVAGWPTNRFYELLVSSRKQDATDFLAWWDAHKDDAEVKQVLVDVKDDTPMWQRLDTVFSAVARQRGIDLRMTEEAKIEMEEQLYSRLLKERDFVERTLLLNRGNLYTVASLRIGDEAALKSVEEERTTFLAARTELEQQLHAFETNRPGVAKRIQMRVLPTALAVQSAAVLFHTTLLAFSFPLHLIKKALSWYTKLPDVHAIPPPTPNPNNDFYRPKIKF